VLLQQHPAVFYDFVVEDEVCLDGVEGQKFLGPEQVLEVFLGVSGEGFSIDVCDHVSDLVVFLEDGGDGGLDVFVALDQLQLLLQDGRAEVADVLDLLL